MKWLKKNWKTTLAGTLTLAATAYGIYANPAAALNPQTVSAIAAGLGLIVAADSQQTPPKPAQ